MKRFLKFTSARKWAVAWIQLAGVAFLGIDIPSARAQTILWGSPSNVINLTSQGGPVALDSSFAFQLGAFVAGDTPGWAPTAANTGEWAEHWVPADSAAYDPLRKCFIGAYTAEGGFAGRHAFIWGFRQNASQGEWLLATAATWVFPDPGKTSPLAFPLSWQTSSAAIVIVGDVRSASGAPFHMRTAAIGPRPAPLLPATQWRGMYFLPEQLNDVAAGGWSADPDGDGRSNLHEFALGTLPLESDTPGAPGLGLTEVGGQQFLSLTVARPANTDLAFTAEVSDDLVHWREGSPDVILQSESETEMTFRDTVPVSGAQSLRMIRVRFRLPEEGP